MSISVYLYHNGYVIIMVNLDTDSLSLPTRTKYSQNFDFNFKGLVS